MSNHFKLDRESFQQLLANAFAVQESEIDKETLTAFVEIERLVASGELDVAGVMNLIVESARCVANAAGVAIGLLYGGQLIYCAGSGSAASDVERRVTASITASADMVANREILRVENADEDTRIQAAICRQLEAKSLLALPICREGVLAGVLEIRFSDAHCFQEHEVRTYRLMTSLIEETALRAAQRAARNESLEPHALPLAQIAPGEEIQDTMLFSYGSMASPADTFFERCALALATMREAPVFRQSATWAKMWAKMCAAKMCAVKTWPNVRSKIRSNLRPAARPAMLATTLATTFATALATIAAQRAKKVTWHNSRNLAFGGATAVLLFGLGIAYKSRGPAAPGGFSAHTGAAINQPALLQTAKPSPSDGSSERLATALPLQGIKSSGMTGRRARVGANEVDYVRGDVTVRYFTSKSAAQWSPARKVRVTHIGQDVTVRYFAPEATLRPASQ